MEENMDYQTYNTIISFDNKINTTYTRLLEKKNNNKKKKKEIYIPNMMTFKFLYLLTSKSSTQIITSSYKIHITYHFEGQNLDLNGYRHVGS